MKKLFYKILISICLLSSCGLIYGMSNVPKTVDEMTLEELKNEQARLNKIHLLMRDETTKKQLRDVETLVIKKKNESKSVSSLTEGAKKFRQTTSAMRQGLEEKKQQSKAQSEYYLNNIQNIKKLVATSNKLFVLYKDQENEESPLKVAQLDESNAFSKIDIENPHIPQPSEKEEKITWLAEPAQSFCDIASYKNTHAYGYFFKQKTWGPFQSDMSVIDFADENGDIYFVIPAHKTSIKSLFLDQHFIASHSQAGNIRFFSLNKFRMNEEVKEHIKEHKAERLVNYNNFCMVYEKSSALGGIGLYVARIDQNAEIVTEKKIGSYQKGDESPYLAAINESGDTLIYDQYHRSLTVCKYTNNKKIIEQKFKNIDLPKQLKYRVAQQIHYIQDKAVLVFDDQIYTIELESSTFQLNRIFHTRKSNTEKVRGFIQQKSHNYVKTVVTTALQDNTTLWIISSKEFDAQEEQPPIEYSIQRVSLDAAK